MHKISIRNRYFLSFGIPLLLILTLWLLVNSPIFQQHPAALSKAITLDLAFTIPIIYFLLIRKKPIPKTSTVVLFVLGIVMASLIIPKSQQFYLAQIKQWVLPLVEITVLLTIIFKIRKLLRSFKRQKQNSPDFYTALQQVARTVFPKGIRTIFTSEIAVIYYSFFQWQKKRWTSKDFSYHKNSGTPALLYAVIFLIIIETVVVHILLQQWSTTVAWITSLLSFYTALQILGILRSMYKRPISLEEGTLQLRYGCFSESSIPLDAITHISLSSKPLESTTLHRKLSPLKDIESHNVIIKLSEENILKGLYGSKKTYTTIAFYVDEKERFERELKKAIQKYPHSNT